VKPIPILALAVAVALLAGCGQKPAPEPEKAPAAKSEPGEVRLSPELQKTAGVQVVAVEKRTVPVTIRVNGRLTADEEKSHKVGALIDGRIVQVFANVGDKVRKGQVLARLHSHDIHESRSQFQKARVELARLETQRAFAERNRDRIRRLFELKAASREQLDYAENELKTAAAGIENARLELERTRQHLEEYLEVPVEAGDTAPVKAPADGIVVTRAITVGSVVKPGDDLFLVSDLTSIWMISAVPEVHLGAIRSGISAQVFIRAFENRPFAGRLTRIGDQLDPSTRTVQGRIVLSNPRGELKPEMYATAELAAGDTAEAIYVPQESLQEMNGHAIVFLATGPGKFQARAVETGARAGGAVAIVSGLAPGDQVVARGAFLLKSEMLKSTLAEE